MLQRYAVTFNKPSLAPLIFAPDPPLRLDEQRGAPARLGAGPLNSRPQLSVVSAGEGGSTCLLV